MLLMVAAAPREFAGFPSLVRRASGRVRWLAAAQVRGGEALLAANGVGRRAAASATRTLLARNPVRAVISTGLAGALEPAFRVGDVFLADAVRDESREYPALPPTRCSAAVRRGVLLTVDRIAQSPAVKARLAAKGAQAVDMEAAGVAEVARENGLPFFCIRSISDAADQALPLDFNRALQPDGTFSAGSVLAQAWLQPGQWTELFRLWRGAGRAAGALAKCLAGSEFLP